MTTAETAQGPIKINGGEKIHYGDKYGSPCGAGYNRRGGVPQVRFMAEGTEVTCGRCAKHVK